MYQFGGLDVQAAARAPASQSLKRAGSGLHSGRAKNAPARPARRLLPAVLVIRLASCLGSPTAAAGKSLKKKAQSLLSQPAILSRPPGGRSREAKDTEPLARVSAWHPVILSFRSNRRIPGRLGMTKPPPPHRQAVWWGVVCLSNLKTLNELSKSYRSGKVLRGGGPKQKTLAPPTHKERTPPPAAEPKIKPKPFRFWFED